jgi:hypothetical protein
LLAVAALVRHVVELGKRMGHPVRRHRSSVRAFVPVSP